MASSITRDAWGKILSEVAETYKIGSGQLETPLQLACMAVIMLFEQILLIIKMLLPPDPDHTDLIRSDQIRSDQISIFILTMTRDLWGNIKDW